MTLRDYKFQFVGFQTCSFSELIATDIRVPQCHYEMLLSSVLN